MPFEYCINILFQSLSARSYAYSLHIEMWSIMSNGDDENQAHILPLWVQEQPLFLVYSSITIFTSVVHRSEYSDAGADQK